MGVIGSIKKNGLKYFTFPRIKAFIRSKIRKVTNIKIPQDHAIEYAEIIVYKSLTCPECVNAGKCVKCDCPINELFTSMDVPCSDGKFPAFGKKWWESWNKYKKKEKVFLNKFYG